MRLAHLLTLTFLTTACATVALIMLTNNANNDTVTHEAPAATTRTVQLETSASVGKATFDLSDGWSHAPTIGIDSSIGTFTNGALVISYDYGGYSFTGTPDTSNDNYDISFRQIEDKELKISIPKTNTGASELFIEGLSTHVFSASSPDDGALNDAQTALTRQISLVMYAYDLSDSENKQFQQFAQGITIKN